jgi:hypothetical protein
LETSQAAAVWILIVGEWYPLSNPTTIRPITRTTVTTSPVPARRCLEGIRRTTLGHM